MLPVATKVSKIYFAQTTAKHDSQHEKQKHDTIHNL